MLQPGLVLESDLTNVEVVAVYALTMGRASDAPEFAHDRGRDARFLLTRGKVESALSALWEDDHVFSIRMIPALRFDSRHGCIVVADVWGDSEYRAFTGKRGQHYFRPSTPLLSIANAAEAERHSGAEIWVGIAQRGDTEILAPRRPPRSWLAYSPDDPWADEENTYPTSTVRAVVRNFHAARELTEKG